MAVTIKVVKKRALDAPRPANPPVEAAPQDRSSGFEEAFNTHWNRVCGLLSRLVGDPDEAEDLALEVFWRLYRKPPETGPGRSLAGWLYRVATNLGYNALRARKRRKQYEEEAGIWDFEHAASHNPAIESEQAEDRRLVRRALAQIKPRSAQLLILRHSGFSYAEIAEALDIPLSSMGTLLARAEQEFEKQYQKLEGR